MISFYRVVFFTIELLLIFSLSIPGLRTNAFTFDTKSIPFHGRFPLKSLKLNALNDNIFPDIVPSSYSGLEDDMLQSVQRTLDNNITLGQGGLWSIDMLTPG